MNRLHQERGNQTIRRRHRQYFRSSRFDDAISVCLITDTKVQWTSLVGQRIVKSWDAILMARLASERLYQ